MKQSLLCSEHVHFFGQTPASRPVGQQTVFLFVAFMTFAAFLRKQTSFLMLPVLIPVFFLCTAASASGAESEKLFAIFPCNTYLLTAPNTLCWRDTADNADSAVYIVEVFREGLFSGERQRILRRQLRNTNCTSFEAAIKKAHPYSWRVSRQGDADSGARYYFQIVSPLEKKRLQQKLDLLMGESQESCQPYSLCIAATFCYSSRLYYRALWYTARIPEPLQSWSLIRELEERILQEMDLTREQAAWLKTNAGQNMLERYMTGP